MKKRISVRSAAVEGKGHRALSRLLLGAALLAPLVGCALSLSGKARAKQISAAVSAASPARLETVLSRFRLHTARDPTGVPLCSLSTDSEKAACCGAPGHIRSAPLYPGGQLTFRKGVSAFPFAAVSC